MQGAWGSRAGVMALWMLASCDRSRAVGIEPAALEPGRTLTVSGERLDEVPGVRIGELELAWTEVAPTQGTVTVPMDLPSGVHELRLQRGEGWLGPRGRPSFEVWRPETEQPCTKRYALKVATERIGRRVTVTRIFVDRDPEELVFPGDELRAVEHEERPLEGGRRCAALWLHATGGRRVLIADSQEADLRVQADALSASLEVPLGVPEPEPPAAVDEVPEDQAADLEVGEEAALGESDAAE